MLGWVGLCILYPKSFSLWCLHNKDRLHRSWRLLRWWTPIIDYRSKSRFNAWFRYPISWATYKKRLFPHTQMSSSYRPSIPLSRLQSYIAPPPTKYHFYNHNNIHPRSSTSPRHHGYEGSSALPPYHSIIRLLYLIFLYLFIYI